MTIDINELVNDRSKLGKDTLPELKAVVEKFPFYQTARLLYVYNLFLEHSPEFGSELRKASVFLPDRSSLFLLTEGTHYELESAVNRKRINIETENNDNRTITLIDSFLQQSKTDISTGKKTQPSLVDLTNDYASFLLQMDGEDANTTNNANETEVPKLKGGELIDSFIEETKDKQRFEISDLKNDYMDENTEEEKNTEKFISPQFSDEDEEIYTESMVNIYIKQGRYEQALQILNKICLNNPKKSANFAAQIQLLEVIINGK